MPEPVARVTKLKLKMILPEVHLCQSLQELSANEPIGRVPQSKKVYHQLQAQLTEGTAAHGHEAVLKHTFKKVSLLTHTPNDY